MSEVMISPSPYRESFRYPTLFAISIKSGEVLDLISVFNLAALTKSRL